jgi:hypothetical protein
MDLYLTRPAGLETFDAVAAVCVAELLAAGRGRTEGRRTAGPPDRRMTGCARW